MTCETGVNGHFPYIRATAQPVLAREGRCGPRDCTEGIDGWSIDSGRGLALVGNSAGPGNAQHELAEDGSFACHRYHHGRLGINRFL
jgi:hypothetical protein